MKNNFKGGMSSDLTAFGVAKKWKISPVEFIPILEKGTEHEMEHTDDKDIARRIALDHIVERLDYYDQLDKIEKMSKGGDTDRNFNDKELLKRYNDGKSIGFTAIAHLKAQGLIKRADGTKRKSVGIFEQGGLIAPNGKESNLTPEQYKLVRSQAFKDWFGDWENDPENSSKVVDENGEPLVVYHGTKKVFTSFYEIPFLGSEHESLNFFTTSYKTSVDNYDGWITYPCFLKIVHPLRDLKGTPESSITLEKNKGLKTDGFIFSGGTLEKPKTDTETWLAVPKSNQIKLASQPIIKTKNKKIIEKANKLFWDGDGSNTTFDSGNPDIRFAKGGLIAPNGNESNLTPEQYKLVRTKAFKDWFGDWENDPENASKIVDENGEPNMCFHGTKNDFFEFSERYIASANDSGFYGKGFYFTFQKEFKDRNYAINEASYYGNKILNCYIKSINPFNFSILSIYKNKDIRYVGAESLVFLTNISILFPQISNEIYIERNTWNKLTQEYDVEKVPISILPNLVNKYANDLKLIEGIGQFDTKETIGYVKSEIVKYDYTDEGGTKGEYESFEELGRVHSEISKEQKEIIFIERAIEKYEGISFRFQPEGYMTRNSIITDAIKKDHDCILQTKYGDELVVFNTNQIKLADGSNTTFDSGNSDIRFDEGGLTSKNENYTMGFERTPKLIKIERRAWLAHNRDGRRLESKVMDEIRDRWEEEVSRISSGRERYSMKIADSNGEVYYYNFGDVLA